VLIPDYGQEMTVGEKAPLGLEGSRSRLTQRQQLVGSREPLWQGAASDRGFPSARASQPQQKPCRLSRLLLHSVWHHRLVLSLSAVRRIAATARCCSSTFDTSTARTRRAFGQW
jgi:hypothetical protein